MKKFIEKLKNKKDLSFEESKAAFEILMDGKASDDEIFNFLTLLSNKGEVSDEIAGGIYVLRNKSKRVNVKDCVDTCGTGGDGMNTLNISTASALLLSSMGIKVAKHGNKAISSKPSSLLTIQAYLTFTFFKASAKIFNKFLSKTPTTCLSTRAGLLSGPIILNIVLLPIFFLVGPTNLIAL